MRNSIKVGVSFGLTSGIITTLGVMVGLDVGTGLKLAVIGGILTVAVADAFSDALGIHIAEESNKKNSHRAIWESTITTFLAKLIVALTFIIPILFFNLRTAVIIGVVWAFILLVIFNYALARERGESPAETIFVHIGIAVAVLIATYFVGKLIAFYFG